ncbi:phage holin family protein [Desulfovibrio inopinatus]|uniref:phage holin family protein n=1 Tax=Desulfovibrio inopinatus TaxID=102109 RepID=UPI000401F947|nr:phage holin family protein [Desulfovibrio inopinatus]
MTNRFSGLIDASNRFLGLALDLAKNRLELVSIELREETTFLLSMFIWGCLAVVLTLMTLVLVTFTVVFLLDASLRPIALIVATALYAFSATLILIVMKYKLKNRKPPFAATAAELAKDRQCLQDAPPH